MKNSLLAVLLVALLVAFMSQVEANDGHELWVVTQHKNSDAQPLGQS